MARNPARAASSPPLRRIPPVPTPLRSPAGRSDARRTDAPPGGPHRGGRGRSAEPPRDPPASISPWLPAWKTLAPSQRSCAVKPKAFSQASRPSPASSARNPCPGSRTRSRRRAPSSRWIRMPAWRSAKLRFRTVPQDEPSSQFHPLPAELEPVGVVPVDPVEEVHQRPFQRGLAGFVGTVDGREPRPPGHVERELPEDPLAAGLESGQFHAAPSPAVRALELPRRRMSGRKILPRIPAGIALSMERYARIFQEQRFRRFHREEAGPGLGQAKLPRSLSGASWLPGTMATWQPCRTRSPIFPAKKAAARQSRMPESKVSPESGRSRARSRRQ